MDLHQIVNIELARSTNYLPMGYWDKNVTYSLTDMGVPFVKVPGGTGSQFFIYALKVDHSTKGANPATMPNEWRFIESAEFIYMQDAYIEKLQAILITAQTIEALDISVKRLRTPFLELEDSDASYNSSRKVYKINNDLNLSSNGNNMYNIRNYEDWVELPDDPSYIGSRIVLLNNNFPPYTYSAYTTARTVACVSSSSKSLGIGIGGKPKGDTLQYIDPNAVSFLGRAIEFLCVPVLKQGIVRSYWIILNWSADIREETWS